MSCVAAQRANLTLVPRSVEDRAEQISFCSHCAGWVPAMRTVSRVCPICGLGLILNASAELAPEEGGAFLVLDGSLSVCAVSRTAERLLEISETNAVHRHLTTFLSPADGEGDGMRDLALAVARAIRGRSTPRELTVKPANTFGIRLGARIGSCGPHPAALLVLE